MENSAKYKVAGIGELLWDYFPSGKRIGGAPANFCYHCQVLGAQAYLISSVGVDNNGLKIREELRSSGINDSFLSCDTSHPTGTVNVILDKRGQPDYTITEDVAYDFIPLKVEYLEVADILDAVCFGTLALRSAVSAETIKAIVGRVSKLKIRVLDLNLRQSYYDDRSIQEALQLCNVLKINEQELDTLTTLLHLSQSHHDAIKELTGVFELKAVALTRGERGSLLFTEGNYFSHSGFPVKVCNAVGAGDAFTAALVMGMLQGDAPELINERANRLASRVCQLEGATIL